MSLIHFTKLSDELILKLESIFSVVKENENMQVPKNIGVCTHNGIQSINLMQTGFSEILKQILCEIELDASFNLFHVHSIEYMIGGHQREHNHPNDDYSFIIYFDTVSGGNTMFDLIEHKLMVDQIRGNVVVFPGNIRHLGSNVSDRKRILVGALKRIDATMR